MSSVYNSKPFKWDRPNEGLYEGGAIRIYDKDAAGNFTLARRATDEEIRFIMLYELLQNSLGAVSRMCNDVENIDGNIQNFLERTK